MSELPNFLQQAIKSGLQIYIATPSLCKCFGLGKDATAPIQSTICISKNKVRAFCAHLDIQLSTAPQKNQN